MASCGGWSLHRGMAAALFSGTRGSWGGGDVIATAGSQFSGHGSIWVCV